MKRIVDNMKDGGRTPDLTQYIVIFLKFVQSVVPTIDYDTMEVRAHRALRGPREGARRPARRRRGGRHRRRAGSRSPVPRMGAARGRGGGDAKKRPQKPREAEDAGRGYAAALDGAEIGVRGGVDTPRALAPAPGELTR